MPMIAIWDDHETANDSWRDGAQNHDASEGSWDTRKEAALRAYFDWMPVRDPVAGRAKDTFYRDYRFGDLISMVAVETRLTARAEPLIVEEYVEEITTDLEKVQIGVFEQSVARNAGIGTAGLHRRHLRQEQGRRGAVADAGQSGHDGTGQ